MEKGDWIVMGGIFATVLLASIVGDFIVLWWIGV